MKKHFLIKKQIRPQSYLYCHKNGESIISVMDMAGNSSTVTINVTEIDDNVMELLFGLQSDGSDMTTDIDKLDIKAGDILYVKSSKDAQIICNGRSFALKADETGSVIVSTNAGMHMLRAVDTSTGKEQSYKVLMTLKDSSAPLISFDSADTQLLNGKQTVRLLKMHLRVVLPLRIIRTE